jgi:hypothetical protein
MRNQCGNNAETIRPALAKPSVVWDLRGRGHCIAFRLSFPPLQVASSSACAVSSLSQCPGQWLPGCHMCIYIYKYKYIYIYIYMYVYILFLRMHTDRHEYSTAPPRPPQARKHGKNYAETKWPSCPTKGCLRRDGLTGSRAGNKNTL